MTWRVKYHPTLDSLIRYISNLWFKYKLGFLWRYKWNSIQQFIHLLDTAQTCQSNPGFGCYVVVCEMASNRFIRLFGTCLTCYLNPSFGSYHMLTEIPVKGWVTFSVEFWHVIRIDAYVVVTWEVKDYHRVQSVMRNSSNIYLKSKLSLLSRWKSMTILQLV
jgi:hypothetical protein